MCADGVLLEHSEGVFACDESALTGESRDVVKSLDKQPWILSGSSVKLGEGKMVVTCVGLFSEEGIIQKIITGVGAKESKVLLDLEKDRSKVSHLNSLNTNYTSLYNHVAFSYRSLIIYFVVKKING